MARKKTDFAWSPIRVMMKRVGAEIVAREAVDTLIQFLVQRGKKLTEMAIKLAKHSGRKKVSAKDIALAIEYI